MGTLTQHAGISLNQDDLARIKHLQAELHIRQKTDLVRLALLKLEEAVIREKEVARAIKGYADFPESEKETASFLKISMENIGHEDW